MKAGARDSCDTGEADHFRTGGGERTAWFPPSLWFPVGETHLDSGQVPGLVFAEHSTAVDGASQCRWTMTGKILGKQPLRSAAVGWMNRWWADDVAQNRLHPAAFSSYYITHRLRLLRAGSHTYHDNASLVRWNVFKLLKHLSLLLSLPKKKFLLTKLQPSILMHVINKTL